MIDYIQSKDFQKLPGSDIHKQNFKKSLKHFHLKLWKPEQNILIPLIDEFGLDDFLIVVKDDLSKENSPLSKWSKIKMLADNEMKKKIQEYINVFRTNIGQYILPSIGQKVDVVVFPEGVVLDVQQQPYIPNTDNYVGEVPTLKEAFDLVNKKMESFLDGKDLEIYNEAIEKNISPFKSTNIFAAQTGVFLVKIKNSSQWTKDQAEEDVKKIVKQMNDLNEKVPSQKSDL